MKSSFNKSIRDANDESKICITDSHSIQKKKDNNLDLTQLITTFEHDDIEINIIEKIHKICNDVDICILKKSDSKFTVIIFEFSDLEINIFRYDILLSPIIKRYYSVKTWKEEIFVHPELLNILDSKYDICNANDHPFFQAIKLGCKLEDNIIACQKERMIYVSSHYRTSIELEYPNNFIQSLIDAHLTSSDSICHLNIIMSIINDIWKIKFNEEHNFEIYVVRKVNNIVHLHIIRFSNVKYDRQTDFYLFKWGNLYINIDIIYYEITLSSNMEKIVFPKCI